ncbi:hypothetical protein J2Z66_005100 [Paenibacillus eucommiae]|uniref:Uncharacterized protein n=1 Tax=Paenibacillus eucommiae TaxID=1355755 RepID=A0ABS4J113_9BACL|nr:hypothetical protein [Paenibacillus eucommiae]
MIPGNRQTFASKGMHGANSCGDALRRSFWEMRKDIDIY